MTWHFLEVWGLLIVAFAIGGILGTLLYIAFAASPLAGAQVALADAIDDRIQAMRDSLRRRDAAGPYGVRREVPAPGFVAPRPIPLPAVGLPEPAAPADVEGGHGGVHVDPPAPGAAMWVETAGYAEAEVDPDEEMADDEPYWDDEEARWSSETADEDSDAAIAAEEAGTWEDEPWVAPAEDELIDGAPVLRGTVVPVAADAEEADYSPPAVPAEEALPLTDADVVVPPPEEPGGAPEPAPQGPARIALPPLPPPLPAAAEPEPDLPSTRPLTLPGPRNGVPDNLQRIRGIGQKNEALLHSLGIYHFGQIAAWTPAEARWVAGHMAFPERIERDDWVGQAIIIATGGDTGFVKRRREAEDEEPPAAGRG